MNISHACSLVSYLTFHDPWEDKVGDAFHQEHQGKQGSLRAAMTSSSAL